MAVGTHVYQAPKGTRDFHPDDMAVRRYIESIWREVSINHGFDEIDGPTFEHLDLYKVKSGDEIESQLFSFRRHDGDTDYALRPEFTPTLARMYAAQAGSLSKPTKWFSIGPYFRAERPQRGRLREHIQLNVDFVGVSEEGGMQKAHQEVEMLSTLIEMLRAFGLGPTDVRLKLGQRKAVVRKLRDYGRPEETLDEDLALLDERLKIGVHEYRRRARDHGWPEDLIRYYDPQEREIVRLDADPADLPLAPQERQMICEKFENPNDLFGAIRNAELAEWCEFDSMIIRGLAYYTDLVFEVHETAGKERAIAGGGRYDKLVELFDGPATPACGFAMGDVVLRLVLEENGLLKPASEYRPRPHAFVISSGADVAEAKLKPLVASLRHHGLHVRHSYRATRNVGKLLGEAAKTRAYYAVILGEELNDDRVVVKDLESGQQQDLAVDQLASFLTQSNQR